MPQQHPVVKSYAEQALSSRQKNILRDIECTLADLRRYQGRAVLGLPKDEWEQFSTRYKRYEKVMIKACAAGLADHPLVSGWVKARRGLGAWDTLRSARVGLEKGVKRPIPAKSVRDLWMAIEELRKPTKEGKPGKSLEAIRRLLKQRGIITPMSQQNFNKLVARLNTVEALVAVNDGKKKTVYRSRATEGKSSMPTPQVVETRVKVRLQKIRTRKPPKKP